MSIIYSVGHEFLSVSEHIKPRGWMENQDRELWEVTKQKPSLLVNAAVQGAATPNENFLDGPKT